ncbi:hypothetical protein V8E36_004963, partial [Tilletia maclaganii]
FTTTLTPSLSLSLSLSLIHHFFRFIPKTSIAYTTPQSLPTHCSINPLVRFASLSPFNVQLLLTLVSLPSYHTHT